MLPKGRAARNEYVQESRPSDPRRGDQRTGSALGGGGGTVWICVAYDRCESDLADETGSATPVDVIITGFTGSDTDGSATDDLQDSGRTAEQDAGGWPTRPSSSGSAGFQGRTPWWWHGATPSMGPDTAPMNGAGPNYVLWRVATRRCRIDAWENPALVPLPA